MPLYDYRCETCGKSFEFLARTLSSKPEACPSCGGTRLTKALSAFAAVSHGGGGDGCARAEACPHAHGPGCGCCCHT